jgi:hypothetical protein
MMAHRQTPVAVSVAVVQSQQQQQAETLDKPHAMIVILDEML